MKDFARVRKWDSQRALKFVVVYRQAGKRQVRYFKDEKGAKLFAQEKTTELRNEGRRHGEFSYDERQAVLEARSRGLNLRAAVEYFAAHREALNASITVETATREFLSVREAEGKSRGHVHDLLYRLRRFARESGGSVLVASFSTREVDAWLAGLACGPQSRVNYRRAIHNFFAFCEARGYCAGNPVTRASKAKVPPGEIGILTPAQAEALLTEFRSAKPECSEDSIRSPNRILPAVAIGLFAGLRVSEIMRLDWSSVDLSRGLIEVAARKSKTAQRRLVTVSPNLRAWLEPLARGAGPVAPQAGTYRRQLARARRAAGIEPWPRNALRHSFASYHLALHRNAAETALQLGHSESRTLFAHYRELVKPDDAKAFWQIFP